jgi:sulfur carrier protein ThiS adenylyltransferase
MTQPSPHDRYSRQELFQPIGPEGQSKLRQSRVLIVGAGALGTAIAESLVRSGVGKLVIVDRDYVEWSNLQRQQLYSEADAEQRLPKAVAAKNRLEQINSGVKIEAHVTDVTTKEIESLASDVDLIMDATDNFDTRMLINDFAQKHSIPWIYGACVGSYGLSYTFVPGDTPCLHCLLDTIPAGGATCDTVGIIPPVVGMVVAHQTAEAFKLLTDNRGALRGKLVSFDLWTNQFASINLDQARKSDCPSCGERPTYPYLSSDNLEKTAILCGRDTVHIRPPKGVKRDLREAAERLTVLPEVKVETANPYLLSFAVRESRLVLFADGRILVHGTTDVVEARSLVSRYLG